MFLDEVFQEVPTYMFSVFTSFAIRNRNLLVTKSSFTAATSISLALHACVVNVQPLMLTENDGILSLSCIAVV